MVAPRRAAPVPRLSPFQVSPFVAGCVCEKASVCLKYFWRPRLLVQGLLWFFAREARNLRMSHSRYFGLNVMRLCCPTLEIRIGALQEETAIGANLATAPEGFDLVRNEKMIGSARPQRRCPHRRSASGRRSGRITTRGKMVYYSTISYSMIEYKLM